MLFAFYDDVQVNGKAPASPNVNGATVSGDVQMSSTPDSPDSKHPVIPQKRPRGPLKQDPVDDLLDEQDGKIPRQRDPKMCKHGPKGMCDYCMPLEVPSLASLSIFFTEYTYS
jgi:nuclear protein localization protein 4 homolog